MIGLDPSHSYFIPNVFSLILGSKVTYEKQGIQGDCHLCRYFLIIFEQVRENLHGCSCSYLILRILDIVVIN